METETEINLQYGKRPEMFNMPEYKMTAELRAAFKEWANKTIRENTFSRNQPLVYRRQSDDKMVAEYKDGRIEIIR